MIIPDKKKAVGMILARVGKDGSEKQMDVKAEEDMEAGPLKAIAEDMMQAFHDKSVMGLESALNALVDHVQVADQEQDAQEEAE